MYTHSIVWKLREKGLVRFRRDFEDNDFARRGLPISTEAALEIFRREEPTAYIVEIYEHKPIDPHVMAGLLAHLEQKAIAEGWRSHGD